MRKKRERIGFVRYLLCIACVTALVNIQARAAEPKIAVNPNGKGEVYVEFAFEDVWPDKTTVQLPVDAFAEGTAVRVYYINPVARQNEYQGEVVAADGEVTLTTHGPALYLLTTVDYGTVYVPDAGGRWKRLAIGAAAVLAAAVAGLHYRNKRKKTICQRTKEEE